MNGWAQTKEETLEVIRPYWSYRDEISGPDKFKFKGISNIKFKGISHNYFPQPATGNPTTHSRMENREGGAQARRAAFWPGINISVPYLSAININSKQSEPLIPQQVPERSWATAPAYILYYKRRGYLLVVD